MMHHQYTWLKHPSPDSREQILLQKHFNETEKTCMNTQNNYAKQSLSDISENITENFFLEKYEKIKNTNN